MTNRVRSLLGGCLTLGVVHVGSGHVGNVNERLRIMI